MGSGCFRGCDRVRVNIKGRRLAQIADHGFFRNDVAAVDAEGLAECRYQEIGRARTSVLLRAAAGFSECADAVRVIDRHDHIFGECSVVGARQHHNSIKRRMIAAHTEHAISYNNRACALVRHRFEMSLEIADIEVFIDSLLGRPGQRDRVDNAIVVELVADHRRLIGDERRYQTHKGSIGR